MNLWIVTTGSSDVQLIDNDDLDWDSWWHNIKKFIRRLPFKLTRVVDEDGEPYRLPARVLSIAYYQYPDQIKPHLAFPLLKNFSDKLTKKNISVDQIIVLVSDQTDIFSEDDRETIRCPYWQDTCELYPIVKNYLKEQLPEATVLPLTLKPEASQRGLDDWDAVLDLVDKAFNGLTFATEPETVFVSHQAGTPAISSAVQFCSLAKFGDRVKFLVSNEYNSTLPEKPLEGSNYLRGIRIQEAKALLDSYNYAGLEALIKGYIEDNEDVKTLLNAAKKWNVAKFDDFCEYLKCHSSFASEVTDKTKESNWWWIAYEEAYLAVIRKNQDNIVEAFFHSFRAFEYIFAAWSKREFGGDKDHLEEDKGKFFLKKSILSDNNDYFAKAKFKQNGDPKDDLARLKCRIIGNETVLLDFSTIHKLFRACRNEYERNCKEIEIFWDQKNNKEKNISEKRNSVFHQIQGMSESDLWDFWNITSSQDSNESKARLWEKKLVGFLNFIILNDFPEGFATLEEASLMVKVHQELEKAIANL